MCSFLEKMFRKIHNTVVYPFKVPVVNRARPAMSKPVKTENALIFRNLLCSIILLYQKRPFHHVLKYYMQRVDGGSYYYSTPE